MSGRTPQPAASDLAAWRRLVRCARVAAAEPAQSAGDLAKAEKSAKRSIVIGALNAENPCVRLVRLARQFVAATTRGRRDLFAEILDVCDQLDRRLGSSAPATAPAPQDPPARRLRADIDG